MENGYGGWDVLFRKHPETKFFSLISSMESWEKRDVDSLVHSFIHSFSHSFTHSVHMRAGSSLWCSEQETVSFHYGPHRSQKQGCFLCWIVCLWTKMLPMKRQPWLQWIPNPNVPVAPTVGKCVEFWPWIVLHASYKDLKLNPGSLGLVRKALSLSWIFWGTARLSLPWEHPGQVSVV